MTGLELIGVFAITFVVGFVFTMALISLFGEDW